MIEQQQSVRTGRTFGVTAELKPTQRRNLFNLLHSEIWPDLCDVLEMVCIETETALINTDPAERIKVLENHKMAKAAWQLFEHMQNRIFLESQTYEMSVAKKPLIPQMTEEELRIQSILDATVPNPAEYGGTQEM